MNRDRSACSAHDLADVGSVRGDDRIVAAHGTFGHGHIHGVIEPASGDERSYPTCLILVQILDPATLEQHREPVLGSAPPGLCQYARRHRRGQPAGDRSTVQGPHEPIVPLGGNQGTRVVREPSAHALFAARSASSRSRRDSPAARSSTVSAPASASHSRTPRRPSRASNLSSAALESHAENEVPSSRAARSTRSATVSSRDTDLFVTLIPVTVTPLVVPVTAPSRSTGTGRGPMDDRDQQPDLSVDRG